MTRRVRSLPFAALVLLASSLGAAAEEGKPETCPFSDDEVIRLAESQLAALYATRSVARVSDIGTVPDELTSDIGKYIAHPQALQETRGNAIVIYLAHDETVCAIYGRNIAGGVLQFDMILLPVPASRLSALIDDNIEDLLAGGPAVVRAPSARRMPGEASARAVMPMHRKAVPRGRAPEVILAEIAAILFPGDLFRDIEPAAASVSIVPALNMGRVPFGALDLNGDGRPLIESAVVNVEASLKNVLDQQMYGWTPGLANPAVLGDPDATGDPDWILPRLPGARREAERVAAMLGARAVTDRSATKAMFLPDMAEADYIHVAAHGLASTQNPMDYGFLALTDGRLTAREIQNLRLEGRPVVVLSACQTALGGPLQAGIIGVARAFLLAGAIVVVSSLWNVDDEATADIMLDFVRNLNSMDPSSALRQAQLTARQKWPDPRIWAAFVVFGSRIINQ